MVHSKMILDDGIFRGRMLPVKRVIACASFSSHPAEAISKLASLSERFDVPPK
jgi:putative component of membrane protein insertase Oxa1/YidC/SpoIIIJ protein YidD